jgi:shikimate dehydrogenase
VPRLAVIGFPVAHSRSPAMQNAALETLGLAGEWSYRAVEATPAAFEMTVRELASLGYAGVNVTVPHKEAALALADEASDAARAIGAANTLSFSGKRIAADNTDAAGLLASLPGPIPNPRALVLGAGGAARAAIWALAHAEPPPDGNLPFVTQRVTKGREGPGFQVDVWNRTRSRAEAVFEQLGGPASLGGAVVEAPAQSAYGIVVNTTAVGLHGEDPFAELPLDPAAFAAGQVVVDMVYGDRPSALLAAAAAAGATTVDGLEVLVQQGALSLRTWTGLEPPIEAMRAAARA